MPGYLPEVPQLSFSYDHPYSYSLCLFLYIYLIIRRSNSITVGNSLEAQHYYKRADCTITDAIYSKNKIIHESQQSPVFFDYPAVIIFFYIADSKILKIGSELTTLSKSQGDTAGRISNQKAVGAWQSAVSEEWTFQNHEIVLSTKFLTEPKRLHSKQGHH